jgi:outer membrane phospholipase A
MCGKHWIVLLGSSFAKKENWEACLAEDESFWVSTTYEDWFRIYEAQWVATYRA